MKIIKKNVIVEKYQPFVTANETINVKNNMAGPVLQLEDNSCIIFYDPYQFYKIRATGAIMSNLDEINLDVLRLMYMKNSDDAPEGIKYGNNTIDSVEKYIVNNNDLYRFVFV